MLSSVIRAVVPIEVRGMGLESIPGTAEFAEIRQQRQLGFAAESLTMNDVLGLLVRLLEPAMSA